MKKFLSVLSAVVLLVSPVSACPETMSHWANLRDDTGNVIGQVGCGSAVEILGQCPGNPDRTVVYDYETGCYGTVASVYLYGGTACQYENPLGCNPSYNYDYIGGCDYQASCGGCQSSCDGYNYEASGECSYQACGGYDYYEYEGDYQYGSCDTWAADDPVWLNQYGCGDYEETEPYEYYGDDCSYSDCYDYEEDDDCYWNWDGSDCSGWKVDVDISAQIVVVKYNGVVKLSGSCVSGMAGCEDTPCGDWTILNKQQDTTLVGDDYACPVSYWMPFTESGCGFHDADWRDDFGGDIYEYAGSHGCVNLEHGFAEQMYEMVPDGCSVCIHQ